MLLRAYHGFNVISAREERPQPDGDGWDHVVAFRDGSLSGVLPTLADAIRLVRAAKERGYLEKPLPKDGEPSHAAQLKGAEPLTAADLLPATDAAPTEERTVVVETVPPAQVAAIVDALDAPPAAAD